MPVTSTHIAWRSGVGACSRKPITFARASSVMRNTCCRVVSIMAIARDDSPGAYSGRVSVPAQPQAVNKRLTLIAAILGSTVVTIDGTVVSVALPAIERELGGGLAGQQWTSNAYLLTLGAFLLIGGSLGDIFGERRVFALGVLGFGVTSVLCAIAPTI